MRINIENRVLLVGLKFKPSSQEGVVQLGLQSTSGLYSLSFFLITSLEYSMFIMWLLIL